MRVLIFFSVIVIELCNKKSERNRESENMKNKKLNSGAIAFNFLIFQCLQQQ